MTFVRTDVTAVKFHQDVLFAGTGSYTNIFSKASLKSVQSLLTLQGQKIYGFVPSKCGKKILCFGGKQFTVLSFSGSNRERGEICSRLFTPEVCDDWLHSGIWVDDDKVALLTAHNTVQCWDTASQTLLSQHKSKDNSILYSGLLIPLHNEVLVLAGTVFSEVIIHCCSEAEPLQHLRGHRGVIFSITCDTQKEIIVTTSDDRSLRIWAPNTPSKQKIYTKEYWKHTEMVCKHELYGHLARVMRSCISDNMVFSVGEDGAICFWDFNGKPLRKNLAHQNSPIWAVDADKDTLVTGGGDCGIMVHPLTVTNVNQSYTMDKNADVKKVVFTARRNIVTMTDNCIIYHVDGKDKLEFVLNHTSTYKLLSLCVCKQIIAVSDMDGNLDVFIENCKEDCLQNVIKTKLEFGKILSMHWGDNRHLIFCSQNGEINVVAKGNEVEKVCSYVLPVCKERWLTAAAIDVKNKMTILGDRCGNIHVYVKGEKDPVKTFRKVHGRYGPTSITVKDNEIISTGRDGTIRYFAIKSGKVKYMSSKCLEFQWVEKFLDRDENIICGFQERDFVVYDIRNSNKMLEVPCGGGHRSWDAVRFIDKINGDYEEFIKLIYIKNSDVNKAPFQLSKIVSRNVVNGSHSKEINCLQCCTNDLDKSKVFFVSGGEDTTLRISNIDSGKEFVDRVVYKHLSNIRALKLYKLKDESVLVISAGGRAQICLNIINFEKKQDELKVIFEEVLDYQIRGTDKEKKGSQNWRNCSIDFDPETRVMDIEAIQTDDNNFVVFVGCSDAYLRIYKLNIEETAEFKLINEVKYHKTCILKTHCIKFENKTILITCTTRGETAFWDTSKHNNEFLPFFSTTTNKSGINSIASKVISNEEILVATGGDDNAVHLVLIQIQPNLTSANLRSSFQLDSLHSSQVTGLCVSGEYLVSASIDQRVSLLKWKVEEGIQCEFVSQTFCDVADVQGMEFMESDSDTIKVCVFGKGMEVIELKKPS
ncbi:WD repeat-containing protein 6 [Leguminivora glycinivorella]|uniref:WD repeat-containing protein 6 n=1 Tax=Leguminivora glycinivorella TaxID=1035111 RepID=UPI00200C6009|nr:WD repeat-containing protein 6 [Leguminivora glycinivorella]